MTLAGDVVQLTESLPGVQETLGVSPCLSQGVVGEGPHAHTGDPSSLVEAKGTQVQGHAQLASFWLAWDKWDFVFKKKNRGRKGGKKTSRGLEVGDPFR